jgi:hypothetical protein
MLMNSGSKIAIGNKIVDEKQLQIREGGSGTRKTPNLLFRVIEVSENAEIEL